MPVEIMRKIIVSMNVTLDGYMAGRNCELDWHFNYWNEEMAEHACHQLSKTDTILLGRVTYQAMAQYWPYQSLNLLFPREQIAFADMMNSHLKIVFSKTLEGTQWNNSRLVKKNLANEISKLKRQPGKDMIIYGSGSLVSSLMQSGLIDEYELWVHPVLLGKGKSLFKGLEETHTLRLLKTRSFNSGVIILYYGAA
jgi:dihydrofolate reductase